MILKHSNKRIANTVLVTILVYTFYACKPEKDIIIPNKIATELQSYYDSFLREAAIRGREAKIPQANTGKIKVGQRVLIKFQSYPFEQFGMVEGRLQRLASIPSSDSTFRAIITLPKGLQTTSHKTLPFKNNLNASAEIIMQDVSVAERMFYQFKKLLNH